MTLMASLFMLLTSCLKGETLEKIYAQQQIKLESALQRLANQRSEIEANKVSMSIKLNALEADASQLRGQLQQARKVEDSRLLSMNRMRSQLDALQKEFNYINDALLGDYLNRYEANLSLGELPLLSAELNQYNELSEDPRASRGARLESALKLLANSARRMEALLGGQHYAGDALDPQGYLIEGDYVQIGPLLYFYGQTTGVVQARQSLQARVYPIDSKNNAAIEALALNKEGMAPMDLSLGNALALSGTRDNVLEHLKKGGMGLSHFNFCSSGHGDSTFQITASNSDSVTINQYHQPNLLTLAIRTDSQSTSFSRAATRACTRDAGSSS